MMGELQELAHRGLNKTDSIIKDYEDEIEMANRSRRPPPIDTKVASPIGSPLVLPRDQLPMEQKYSDVAHPGHCDKVLENLRSNDPTQQDKSRPSPPKRNPSRTGYKCVDSIGAPSLPLNSTPEKFVPRIPRHCDDLIEQLRSGMDPSVRRTRPRPSNPQLQYSEYRGVNYTGPVSPTTNGVPDWYRNAQAMLKTKNPHKYMTEEITNTSIDHNTPPPSASLSPGLTDRSYGNFSSIPITLDVTMVQSEKDGNAPQITDTTSLPLSPISPVDQLVVGKEVSPGMSNANGRDEVTGGKNIADIDIDASAIQQDIEHALQLTQLHRSMSQSQPAGASYVNRLRRSIILDPSSKFPLDTHTSVILDDETLASEIENVQDTEPIQNLDETLDTQKLGQTDRAHERGSIHIGDLSLGGNDGEVWDQYLDYYSEVVNAYDDDSEYEELSVKPLSAIIEEPEQRIKSLYATVEDAEDEYDELRKLLGAEDVPVQQTPTIATVDAENRDEILDRDHVNGEIFDKTPARRDSNPPPIPPKRRVPTLPQVVGSDSPPHEIQDKRQQPQVVHSEVSESSIAPPVPPKVTLPRITKSSSAPEPEHVTERTQATQESDFPSLADLSNAMTLDDDQIFDKNAHHRSNKNKAAEVLSMDSVDFFSDPLLDVHPAPHTRLAKEIDRVNLRKDILESDNLQSPRKGIFNGAQRTLRHVAGSLLNLKAGKNGNFDDAPDVESDPTAESPKPGIFKRIFTTDSSTRPSTVGSDKSFGGSLHESWDSGRASGDTGVTSTDETFPPLPPDPPKQEEPLDPVLSMEFFRLNRHLYDIGMPINKIHEKMVAWVTEETKRREAEAKKLNDQDKKTGFLSMFRHETEEEALAREGDEAIGLLRKRIQEKDRKDREEAHKQLGRAYNERVKQRQMKNITTGRPGFYSETGDFYRAKNPLELALCDTEDEEEYYQERKKDNIEQIEEETLSGEPIESRFPSSHSGGNDIPSPIAEEPEFINPQELDSLDDVAQRAGGYSQEVEREPRSHWSDDSDDEYDGHPSQPTTPVNSTFGRSNRSHKRNGSGSSNLGTGPMLMKRAVRKFKGHRKSAATHTETSVPPTPPAKGNRDSFMSHSSTATRESNNAVVSPIPIPVPHVPARGAPDGVAAALGNLEAGSKPSSVSVIPSITTGTYHDHADKVVHQFGGTIPERSASSLGHRGDRNSKIDSIPERCRSSLGDNRSIPGEWSHSQYVQLRRQQKEEKEQKKLMEKLNIETKKREKLKLKQDEMNAKAQKKEGKKEEKKRAAEAKAEKAKEKLARDIEKGTILTGESFGQWA
ncbi:hypothetical protein TWF694_006639 [Orbilia ellipsospora]|uniref:Uncharacterized protein n=1 Tax=Orbilia ellipsospora TaxID=2528407 RepID=A0AAV9XKT5_9PEZI